MDRNSRGGWRQSREAAGFVVSGAFVCLAAVQDVYLGGLFQRVSPLRVAVVAFTLCTLVLLPIALLRARDSLAVLLRQSGDLFWVNVTSALAWLAFFAALRLIEPTLVQILYSGIGPLSVISPLTVRVVLATGPVLIFFIQLLEGRLSASLYSLMAAILYAVAAISAGFARQRAIRSAFPA